jgi:peptidoglycan/xylan/chitin deacetylase (PgdA/CDA1 family)
MNVRKAVKSAGLGVLRSTGVFSVSARSGRRQKQLLILCYHGISLRDEHLWAGSLYMTPALFRSRLELLQMMRANVLPLGEALERLDAGTLPPLSVAITFDDGFVDFYQYAAPLLREFSFPSTLYLTTHYCRYRMPIFNLLASYLFWKSNQSTFEWPEIGYSAVPIDTEYNRAAAVSKLMKWCSEQHLGTPEKDDLGRRLAARLGFDYGDLVQSKLFQIVSEEQASELHRTGIDLQLHTHRHRTPRDQKLFAREIEDNRARLVEITGGENPVHFCYPSGDCDTQFVPWLRESGVISATTCQAGIAQVRSHPLLLPRLLDGEQVSALEFESWVSGVRQ